jgi:hypothetical protein
LFCGDSREIEKKIVERAVEVVFTERSGDLGAALVEGACGDDVSSERHARTAWIGGS